VACRSPTLQDRQTSKLTSTVCPSMRRTAGIALGWTSSVFYLLSRVSQIYKNWSRGATEGLSLHMFGAIVTANLLYVAGILVRADGLSDVTTAAPWLLGTVGTIFLDMTIFYQVPPCSLSSLAVDLSCMAADCGFARIYGDCCVGSATRSPSGSSLDRRPSRRALHVTTTHATDHWQSIEMVGMILS